MSNESVVQKWNELYPPGTKVKLTNDDGQVEDTRTRSIAWLLGSGTPVVSVEGRTGGYLLERIKPVVKTYEEWGYQLIQIICDETQVEAAIKVEEIKCVLRRDGAYLENFEDGDSPEDAWAGEMGSIADSQ